MPSPLHIGIDIGGTFTDFVIYDPETGHLDTFKVLSTPQNPADAVLRGLERVGAARPLAIIHGSTVATNALLERKGAKTALVATAGFRDILQIGRQNRSELYSWSASPPVPLIPEDLRFEVTERVDSRGQVLIPLQTESIEPLLSTLQALSIQSVAICLLFSFLHPEHEQEIAKRLRQAGFFVSTSCEVLPEYREWERTSTTAVNAYVTPVLDRYLYTLESSLTAYGPAGSRLSVMQSNGGRISPQEARKFGVRCILSGPAGGVVGCAQVAKKTTRVLTFDMGGTSTDVALIDKVPQVTTETSIGGWPLGIPVLDIHTIGAGGGSIAWLDAGGALRVGPESAGADPGPACYGRGDLPTVTDANLVLGRLAPDLFLGGEIHLDSGRSLASMARLGRLMGLSPQETALGVTAVINAHMARALRVISVERGFDPRDFTLLAFGGAGGLHATDLARDLGSPRVLLPPLAATLSAFGMLAAEIVKDYACTVMLPGDTAEVEIETHLAPLVERARLDLLAEGAPDGSIRIEPALDLRYRGQSYELPVPFRPGFLKAFHALHRKTYGYDRSGALQAAEVEIVTLRVRATSETVAPPLPILPPGGRDPFQALLEYRPVVSPGGSQEAWPFYQGKALQPGNRLTGPAIIVRSDTTLLLGPTDQAEVDPFGNLLIEVGQL